MRMLYFPALVFSLFFYSQNTLAEPGNAIEIESKASSEIPQSILGPKVQYLGGLEITSTDDDFGGFSGLRIIENDSLFAVTDQGKWLKANLVRKHGKLETLNNVRMGRLRDKAGKKMRGKRQADAEGLEIIGDKFLISFERNHRAQWFRFEKDKLRAVSKNPEITLNGIGLSNNGGPEGIAIAPTTSPIAGSILAFPEHHLAENGNLRVFLFKDKNKERNELFIRPYGGFSITDAAFTANGDLYLLERQLTIFFEAGMRIRKFNTASIQPNSTLDGEEVLTVFGNGLIDNMEGLSVETQEDGSTKLTVMSDDNFSFRQRTLLLEFLYTE